MKIVQRVKFVFVVAVLGFGFVGNASADGLSKELESLNRSLDAVVNENDITEKSRAVRFFVGKVKWSGANDPALFDRLEKDMLLVIQGGTTGGRYGAEYLSWAAQGLAYSGLDKYRSSIEQLTGSGFHKKIRRHAESSLAKLPKFSVWNAQINKGLAGVSAADLPRRRTINFLKSDEGELMRVGASLVKKKYLEDDEMLTIVEKRLLDVYAQTGGDQEKAEALAWMCKVLGMTGNSDYRQTLETVRKNSKDKAVVRWAKKALLQL